MSSSTHTSRLSRGLALALAAVAIAVPAAQAGHQDLGARLALERVRAIQVGSRPTPVDRIRAQEDARRLDPRLHQGFAAAIGPGPDASAIADRFDWGDAGVGAVAGMLLLAVTVLAVRRARGGRLSTQ